MYKMLVVDEEKIVINSVKKIVRNNFSEINTISYAYSGQTAIAISKKERPDIIIIEIKLSGMNGFETIKQIRKILPNVHVIILSDFDYFDFAREAIDLGVDSYILKPINSTQLVRAFNNIILKIKEEKEKNELEIKNYLYFNNIMEFTEYSFIYSVLFNGNPNESIYKYKKILNLSDYGYMLNIEFTNIEEYRINDSDLESKFQFFKSIVSKYHRNIIGPQILNRIIIYVLEDYGDMNDVKQKSESIELSKAIITELKRVYNIEAVIGIGNVYELQNIHQSYEEAIKSLHYSFEHNEMIHIRDVEVKTQINFMNYHDMEQRLIESIKLNKDESVDLFSILLDMIRTMKEEYRRNKIMELLILTCYAASNINPNDDRLINYTQLFEEMKEINENEITTWAVRKFQYILKSVRINRNEKISNITSVAIKYIEEHFNEEISLDDVSRYVCVTPQYFSKLFKEETGYNFVEWITNIRVKKAKDLMNYQDKTIKEVCYLVGYHDPNYFSRIFKKIVGVSPSEYLKGKDKAI